MKLTIPQKTLSAKLSAVSKLVPSNPSHPVLANVMLVATEGTLSLTVFDLTMGLKVSMDATVTEPGEITLPAKFLNDIVSKLPEVDVELEIADQVAKLSCGTGEYELIGLDASEFPELPTIESDAIQLDPKSFSEGLQATLFCATTDASKQILTGLHLSQSDSDGIEFAATDGHRLSVVTKDKEAEWFDQELTIPARALAELKKMTTKGTEKIEMRSDDRTVAFEVHTDGSVERLTCRLLDGTYPAYGQLMPKSFARTVLVDRNLLADSVDIVGVLAARKNNVIRFSFDQDSQRMVLVAEAPEFGQGEEYLAAEVNSESNGPFEIAFNAKYFLDGLKAMSSEKVLISCNEPTMPAVLSPEDGGMEYLIMPIQIR